MKPKEVVKMDPPKEAVIIQKEEVKPVVINVEKKIEPIQIEHNAKPMNSIHEAVEKIPIVPENNLNVLNIEKKTEFIIVEEKPIETNAVIQNEDITHFRVFQEVSISQEEFNKETTFINTSKPNLDNQKQFISWQELKLRKECQEECDTIIETEKPREVSDEMLKEIEEGKYEEITGEDKDVEWEYEEVTKRNE
jgi:hypothetical protein